MIARIERARRWLYDAMTDNIVLKVMSLLASLLFYGYLHGAQNAQRVISVGVVTLVPPDDEGRALLNEPPPTVRLTLLGSRPNLDELRADDIGSVQLDLRQATGTYAPFDLSSLKIPAGLKVDVDPPGILLLWEEVVSRPVPVQIPVAGQPLRGFTVVGAPVAEPSVVAVRGPRSVVELLQFVRSEPFDLDGLDSERTTTRRLQLDVPLARAHLIEERSVLATISIGQARLERVFERRPVQVTGVNVSRAVVLPAEVDVRVVGPPELVESLRAEQLVPVADMHAMGGEARTGTLPVPVTVALEGCSLQVIPPTVVVRW